MTSLVQRGTSLVEPCCWSVGQLFAEPGHGAVEVVQLQGLGTPSRARSSFQRSAARSLPVAHRRCRTVRKTARSTANSKRRSPSSSARTARQPRLLPEAFEDQGGPEAAGADDGRLAAGVGRQQEDLLGEACPGGEQGVELAGVLELVETAEGAEDALAGAAVVARSFRRVAGSGGVRRF